MHIEVHSSKVILSQYDIDNGFHLWIESNNYIFSKQGHFRSKVNCYRNSINKKNEISIAFNNILEHGKKNIVKITIFKAKLAII